MWKRLFCLLTLALAMVCTARAGEVFCRSFDGTELVYDVYSGEEEVAGWIAASYTASGKLLDVKLRRTALPAACREEDTVRFNGGPLAAYARVFLFRDMDKLETVDADRLEVGQCQSRRWDFSAPAFAALGTMTQTTTAEEVSFTAAEGKEIIARSGGIYLSGGGSVDLRSITFPVEGPCRVKINMESTNPSVERTVHIANAQGSLESTTVTERVTWSYDYTGEGELLSIYSAGSALNVYFIELDTGRSPETLWADTWAELKTLTATAPDGGVIYLRGGAVACDSTLMLNEDKALTIRGCGGETTILDFSAWSDSLMNSPAEVGSRGIQITGSNITLRDFIIQGTPGTAINMTGEDCGNLLIERVTARYNHNSGFYASNGAHDITLRCCDSYRNCDIYKKGQDADGFSISVSCGPGLLLDNCRAFANADDAYDNFNNHHDVTYLDCYCWNNGGIDVYTGQYDVDHGLPVDRNLPLVRWMEENSPEFKALLDSAPGGVVAPEDFRLPTDLVMCVRSPDKTSSIEVTLGEYITTVWEGNGNGFKLASGYQSETRPKVEADAYRRLERCVAFDNGAKGFDQNSGSPTVDAVDFFSFRNKRNYMTVLLTPGEELSNLLSYAGTMEDNVGSFPVEGLEQARGEALEAAVRAQVEELVELLEQDVIPGRFILRLDW